MSLCNNCDNAKPKPSCCLDCPFVLTCGTTLPGDLSNRFCPHLNHEHIREIGMSKGVVKACPDYVEVSW